VIAVLASQFDPSASALVSTWSSAGAILLSAEDLCSPGWVFHLQRPADGTAVAGGRTIKVSSIRAVLTRRPGVVAEELRRIHPDDRSYVAAETNAFLLAWLNALPCRIVNRPTARSLCGPAWGTLQWKSVAAKAGLAWHASNDMDEIHTIVICGRKVLFAHNEKERSAALTLAQAANVELLAVRACRGHICGVSVAPELDNAEVRNHLLNYLQEEP
jgi:hypothetical protein